jgi:hypothetical protein
VTTWVKLESILLSEISLAQKESNTWSYMQYIKKLIPEVESRVVGTRGWVGRAEVRGGWGKVDQWVLNYI